MIQSRIYRRSIQKDLTYFFNIFYYELLFNIQMFESDQTKESWDMFSYRQIVTIIDVIYNSFASYWNSYLSMEDFWFKLYLILEKINVRILIRKLA